MPSKSNMNSIRNKESAYRYEKTKKLNFKNVELLFFVLEHTLPKFIQTPHKTVG